jgi:hypothetical protein
MNHHAWLYNILEMTKGQILHGFSHMWNLILIKKQINNDMNVKGVQILGGQISGRAKGGDDWVECDRNTLYACMKIE